MPAAENHSTASRKYKGSRQVHANRTRFDPIRHRPDLELPYQVKRVSTSLCCRRCQLIIRWKIDYGKYPPVGRMKKSVRTCGECAERNVAIPFHHICQDCSQKLAVCAKCRRTPEESEKLAQDAIRVKEGDDGDDEFAFENESDSDEDSSEEEDGEEEYNNKNTASAAISATAGTSSSKVMQQQQQQSTSSAKNNNNNTEDCENDCENDNGEQEEEEEEFPELIPLRGLDCSTIREKLIDERKYEAVLRMKEQGKMSERQRRTAMRRMEKEGDKAGFMIVNSSVEKNQNEAQMLKNMKADTEVELTVGVGASSANKSNQQRLQTKYSEQDAGETDSDEETI